MAETKTRQSKDTKSALAQMVLPETLDDIEEFLKPEFSQRHRHRNAKTQENDADDEEVNGRRIVCDGFGRWREIRPKRYIQSQKLQLVSAPELPEVKRLLGMETPTSSRQSSRGEDGVHKSRYEAYQDSRASSRQGVTPGSRNRSTTQNNSIYNSLGVFTRANVFPGIGNFQWNTTTARTFTKMPITPIEERKNFYGIQSDDFGAWSAANVINERMKKAWGEYLETVPKAKANWDQPPQTTQLVKPKLPEPKPKKHPSKPKPKKDNLVTDHTQFQELENYPSEPQVPAPYIPIDDQTNDDDDFWDFYDKPFTKPNK